MTNRIQWLAKTGDYTHNRFQVDSGRITGKLEIEAFTSRSRRLIVRFAGSWPDTSALIFQLLTGVER